MNILDQKKFMCQFNSNPRNMKKSKRGSGNTITDPATCDSEIYNGFLCY